MKYTIEPYEWRSLKGRLMHVPGPAKKRTNILMVYGQHASLERCSGIAEALQPYGTVWMPDMPGFGGMDSFFKLKTTPSVDNYADYLKDFIDAKIGDEPLMVIGMSFGFANTTRLYQKYPGLLKQTKLIVSFVGFTGARDFKITPWYMKKLMTLGAYATRDPIGAILAHGLLRSGVFEMYYRRSIPKPKPYTLAARKARWAEAHKKMELWHLNDRRTHSSTAYDFIFKLDMRGVKIPFTVHHLGVTFDHYFDHRIVIEHMKEIYAKVVDHNIGLNNHSPSEDASAEEAAKLIPPEMHALLAKLP